MWDRTYKYLESKVRGFEVKIKDGVWHQVLISKVLFFLPFMRYWTTLYPNVWKPSDRPDSWRTLQHEGVHLLDGQTFFGLLPAWPVLKWINLFMFAMCYAAPQILFILALHVFVSSWWWLGFLLFLLPLPSPGRMYAEMRAYRRTRELGGDPDRIAELFVNKNYYFMWPFRKHVKKMLMKDSPYKDEMDQI